MYFLVSGRCTVLKASEKGGGPDKAVAAMGPGSTFGQLGVLGMQPRAASVASVTGCEVRSCHTSAAPQLICLALSALQHKEPVR